VANYYPPVFVLGCWEELSNDRLVKVSIFVWVNGLLVVFVSIPDDFNKEVD